MSRSTASLLVQAKDVSGAQNVIRRFTLRRVLLGASLFGLFAAAESVAQGFGIVSAYPSVVARAKVVYGLANNAALGLFYGDRHSDIVSPGGYMVYRILPILSMIGAIWCMLFVTKMLRGQEENGRWELLLTGRTSAAKATAKTLMGTGGGLLIAYVLLVLILTLSSRGSKFSLTVNGILFYSLAPIAGAAVGLGIGSVVSQLAATRRKAVLYGLSAVIVLFVMRSVGNVVDSLAWLKNLTPFGWIDKLHPFNHENPYWYVALALVSILGTAVGIWLSGKRDMAESLIADTDTAKPKFGLLNSQLGFAIRITRNTLLGWLAASVGLSALIASIDKSVSKALTVSSGLTKTITKLSGNPTSHFEIAYLSAASYFVVLIMMIMATSGMGAAREEEASSRLDNFMSGAVSRRNWLTTRLTVLLSGMVGVTMLSNFVVWIVADTQGIHTSLTTLLFSGLNVLGPVILLLGFGVLLYGIMPRLTTTVMYVLIGWSFTIDLIASAVKTSKYLADASLLHYISLVPAANPNWTQFTVLTIGALVLIGWGVVAFQRRDLEVE
jgi:ABC-2 type transport system permease protein